MQFIKQALIKSLFPKKHLLLPAYFGASVLKSIDIRTFSDFESIATPIILSKKTYLHYDRLYSIYLSLQNISRVFNGISDLNTVEVGVFRGGGSAFIYQTAKRLNLPVNHYAFDTFQGHSAEDICPPFDAEHKAGNFNATSYETVKEYLQTEKETIEVVQGRFQETCNRLNGKEIHFMHLDVDLYDPTSFALGFASKSLQRGAAIVVDDYGNIKCPGVMKAVDEFTEKSMDFFKIHLLTNQAILIKIA